MPLSRPGPRLREIEVNPVVSAALLSPLKACAQIAGAGQVPPEIEESGAAGSEGDVLLYCGGQEGKKHLLKLSQLRDNGDSATEVSINSPGTVNLWVHCRNDNSGCA